MSIDEYFATGSAFERPIYDAVFAHLDSVGPLYVEFVSVGIFFKRLRTFAELRPARDRVVLSVLLSRIVKHPRITRTLKGSGQRFAYFINLYAPRDVDDDIRDWLSEAYAASPT
jgi:hypothetical protein